MPPQALSHSQIIGQRNSASSFDAGQSQYEALSAIGQGQPQQKEAAHLVGYGSDNSPGAVKYRTQVQKGTKLYHHDMPIPNKFLKFDQSSAVDKVVNHLRQSHKKYLGPVFSPESSDEHERLRK